MTSDFQRVDPDTVSAFAAIQTATIHEASGGRGAFRADFRPLARGMGLCGPVLPVRARPGDNLILHQAIYAARPGDILLVDCGGYTEAGKWGGIMMEAALQRGIAGLVTNGSVRDTDEIIARGFPVFSRGISIKGTTKSCAGVIGQPLAMEDTLIQPGDLIRADSDGVVVVPRQDAADVLARSRQREAREAAVMDDLRRGRTTLEIYGFAAGTT